MPKSMFTSPPPKYEPVEYFVCRINNDLMVYSTRLKYIARCQICGGTIPKESRIFTIADRTHNPELGLYTHLYTICSDTCMDIFLVSGDVRYMSDYALNQKDFMVEDSSWKHITTVRRVVNRLGKALHTGYYMQ